MTTLPQYDTPRLSGKMLRHIEESIPNSGIQSLISMRGYLKEMRTAITAELGILQTELVEQNRLEAAIQDRISDLPRKDAEDAE